MPIKIGKYSILILIVSDTVVATEDEGGGTKQCDCSQQFKKVFKLLSDVQSDITAGQGRQRKNDQQISTLSTAMSSVHSKQKLHTNQLDQISSDVSTVNSAHEDMSSRMATLESKSCLNGRAGVHLNVTMKRNIFILNTFKNCMMISNWSATR